MSTRFGAWVARARLQARFGSPIPTKTTSPSRSWRAADTAINSLGVYSVPVIHSRGDAIVRSQPLLQPRVCLEIRRTVRDAVDVPVEVRRETSRVARDRLPCDVEVIVAIVVP